jgi:hypothetical protein
MLALVAGLAARNYASVPIGSYQDDADYIVLARSLVQSRTYGLINYPGQPGVSQFPFGFPLVLAPLVWLFPQNLEVPRAVPLVATVANTALLVWGWRWLGSGLSHWWGLAVAALYGLSPLVIKQSVSVLSEPIFMTYVLAALILAERAALGKAGQGWPIVLGVILFLAASTRVVGIFLILTACAYLLYRRGWEISKALVAAGLTMVACLGLVIALTSVSLVDLWPRRYLTQNASLVSGEGRLTNQTMSYPRLLLRVAGHHLRLEVRAVVFPLGGSTREAAVTARLGLPWLTGAIGLVISATVALGLIWLLARRGLSAFVAFALIYYSLMQLVLWITPRLLYPIQPQLTLGFVMGLAVLGQQAARWMRRPAWGWLPAMAAVVCILAIALFKDVIGVASPDTTGGFPARTQWLAAHSDLGSVILTDLPEIDYLYSGRSAVPLGDYASLADLKSSLASWGVNYILVGSEGNLATVTDLSVRRQMQRILPLVDELRAEGRLTVAYSGPADGITVYQVNPAP